MIAGATSASGLAAARELTRAGARVVAVGRDPGKLGELQDNYYEVLGGLDEGTPVIVGSLQAIREGQPIQPKPAKPLGEEQGVGGGADAGTGGAGDAGTGASTDAGTRPDGGR